MVERPGIFETMGLLPTEEPALLSALFEYKKIPRLKMTTEVVPPLIVPLSVMGVIQERYNSKVLKSYAVQLYLHEVSKDRKGRLELVEALLALRKPAEEEGE